MKHRFLIILLAALCAIASASGQSIRTLGYNTSNNQIVAATNLVWTNSFSFLTNNVTAQVRTNLALGWPALTNSNAATALLGVATNGQVIYSGTNTLQFTNAANTVISFKSASETETLEIVSTDESLTAGYGSSAHGIGVGADGLQIKYGSSNTSWGSPVLTDATGETLLQPFNKTNFRSAIGLGATWLTNTNVTNFRTAVGLGTTNYVVFGSASIGGGPFINGSGVFYVTPTNGGLNLEEGILSDSTNGVVFTWDGLSTIIHAPLSFYTTNAAATSRTNLGLPLAALTNTSNVTIMRALSGSTNTNHPYSGSISVVGTNNTNTLVFSNGILQAVQ